SLAEVLQEDTGVTLPAELSVMLGRLERELRAGAVSAESEAWLAQCGLTAEQMNNQMEEEYIPERKLHLYHCDHRGLPQALISPEGETAWRGEYDEWGNLLGEESTLHLQQPYRLPGQQYDEESGLYYNRHRYYDPLQGRYITQDPIGLAGGWNLYKYPWNPTINIDPLGLDTLIFAGGPTSGNPLGHSAMAFTGKGVYSYGTATPRGGSVIAYLTEQAQRRSTRIYTIKTTPEQEKAMIKYIDEKYKVDRSDYNYFTHNCATMVIEAMLHAGVSVDSINEILTSTDPLGGDNGMPMYLPATVEMIASRVSNTSPLFSPENGPVPSNFTDFNQ
ncbi:RHS repeat-associated core domain-containing protein, partial [Escherichia coli]|uniref:RHS repeat-associated core domain-containing protein n=2 Tax=Escherichia coli TaxID=562 RepID=UPI0030C76490